MFYRQQLLATLTDWYIDYIDFMRAKDMTHHFSEHSWRACGITQNKGKRITCRKSRSCTLGGLWPKCHIDLWSVKICKKVIAGCSVVVTLSGLGLPQLQARREDWVLSAKQPGAAHTVFCSSLWMYGMLTWESFPSSGVFPLEPPLNTFMFHTSLQCAP